MNANANAKPCPTELNSPMNLEMTAGKGATVESHRNLFCPHYDDCLDSAVKRGWMSFTCERCPLYTVTANTKRSKGGIDAYATQRRVS